MTKYNGLQNQGATCYLNSLIQTLFMTYQFRDNLYTFRHDPKRIKQSDSIPFQLQKLFVQLQQSKSSCITRGLQKSFQWDDKNAYQQHDVQQFCRKLFEAVQKSQKQTFWLSQLYTGVTNSYIDCGKHFRSRQQVYMDLSLPIRTFQSLQQCLKEYLKPQSIQGVECQDCNARVSVEKGIKFQRFPPILTIQLNRFQLNYDTLQRQKINSFLYYPQILQLGRFLNPYKEIKLKGIPKDVIKESKQIGKKETARAVDLTFDRQTKPKRKNSFDRQGEKQSVKFLDEEGKNKRKFQQKGLNKEEMKQQSKQFFATLQSQKEKFDKKMQKIKAKELKQIEQDMLFGTVMGMQKPVWTSGSFTKDQIPIYSKSQTKYQHQQQEFKIDKEYQENTYALYAVLVHAGGAYGGHYFAYIFDGVEWFKFDDASVKKVQKWQIRKYGNLSEKQTLHGANAYMLFYRNVKTFKKIQQLKVPEDLLELVKKNEQVEKVEASQKYHLLEQLNKSLLVKIYKNSTELQTIVIQDRFAQTLGSLKNRIKQLFNIQQQNHNWRLRRFNKLQNTMHQIYGDDLNESTLQALGFRQQVYVIAQTKTDEQVFDEYDPRKIVIKINIWRQNIVTLLEQHLKPIKILIKDDGMFEDFFYQVKKKTGLQNPLIMKRNFSAGPPVKVYSLQENLGKKLIDLRFFNSMNLYVENKTQQCKWIEEFQIEKYRCLIHYNNPKVGEDRNQQLYFDTRKTLGDLKKQLSRLIEVENEDFRIKKSKNTVAQLTSYRKKLSQLRFINNQYIYVELGKSSKGSLLIRKGEVKLVQDRIQFELDQQIQVEIDSKVSTVADLKEKIQQITGFTKEKIRIRQYKACQFGEIFVNSDSLQRIRQKSLVWQVTKQEDQRGTQVYLRFFDIMNMNLGPLQEIFIDPQASYEELSYLIEEKLNIPSDRVLCWKTHMGYVDKETLLDCEWVEIRFIKKKARDDPLILNVDGLILIVKQALEPYHPKPQPIHKSYGQSTDNVKEPSLQITVIEQTMEIIEQKQK